MYVRHVCLVMYVNVIKTEVAAETFEFRWNRKVLKLEEQKMVSFYQRFKIKIKCHVSNVVGSCQESILAGDERKDHLLWQWPQWPDRAQ